MGAGVCTAQHEANPKTNKPPVTSPPSTAQPPKVILRQPLDRVVATINKKTILLSQLRPEFLARVAGLQVSERRSLSTAERHQIMRRLLEQEVDRAVLAEAAASLGNHDPARVRAWLDRAQKAQMDERIKKWGSLNKFHRELSRFGTSAFALEEQDRTRLKMQLARQDLRRRIGDQQSLLVTPKEMHKLWKRVRPKRRRPPGTMVAMVALAPGHEPGEALGQARKLARDWAQGDATAQEIATRYGWTAVPDKNVTTTGEDPAAAWIKEFAAGTGAGDVSKPVVRQDGSVWVLKALEKDPGDDYRFSDPAVQRSLRIQIEDQKMRQLHMRQYRRSRSQVAFWKTDDFSPPELR